VSAITDAQGNLHRSSGPGAGRFESKPAMRPKSPMPLPAEDEVARMSGQVSAVWHEAPVTQGQPSVARHSDFAIAIDQRTGAQAPVVAEVFPNGVERPPLPYRQISGNLFRQSFGIQDPTSGIVVPLPSLNRDVVRAYRQAQLPVSDEAYANTRRRGRHTDTESLEALAAAVESGAVVPVPADENWMRATAAREASTIVARDQTEAALELQARMDGFASVDGHVWEESRPPVYRAPIVEEAPFERPVRVTVEVAPDTSLAAADGYYPSDEYRQAVERVFDTAKRTGSPIAPMPDEPPIKWLVELGLVDEGGWRRGAQLAISPSSALTEQNWRDRMAAFRAEIVEHLPDAVAGDIGAFLIVPGFRLDLTAMTKTQQAEYRRYVMFALAHGLT